MTKAEIIEYLYDNHVRGDLSIEEMAEDLADRKTENSSEKPNNCEVEPQYDFSEYADRLWKIAYERGKREALEQDEPTISKMEQVEDETRLTAKCLNCANGGSYKCSKCDGEMYYKYDKDEPQTCFNCKHNVTKHTFDHACGGCANMNRWERDEPKTQMKTQNSNLTFKKRTMRDCYNCKRYETEDECIECHYEPKDEPQNGYHIFNGTSVYVSRLEDEPQTDNGIGCSRCEGRYDCCDRDMPHAIHCNNYGKITDEPQTDCPWK